VPHRPKNSNRRLRARWAFAPLLAISALLVCASVRDAQAQSSTVARPDGAAQATAPTDSGGSASRPESTAPVKPGNTANPFGAMGFSTDNGPINIKSDSMDLDYKRNHVTFKGHVHAVQSGTTLVSDTLSVIYVSNQNGPAHGNGADQAKSKPAGSPDPKGDPDPAGMNQIKEVTALGNVKIDQGGRYATGQKAVFNQANRTVEMTGSPVIHDGPDQITGTKILIYLDSQKSVVEGAHAVIFPRKSENSDNSGSGKDHHGS